MILTAPPPRPRGPAIGWGISLLVHALLVAWLLHARAPAPSVAPAPKRIDFVLVMPQRAPAAPAAAEPEPKPEPERAPAAAPVAPARSPSRRDEPARAAPPHATAADVVHVDTPAPFAVAPSAPDAADAPPSAASAAAPAFDMDAARNTARAAAREPGRGNLVDRPKLAPTLDPGLEAREDKLARDIERSTKSDCKTAYAGAGLLAVIPLLHDAVTGKGCKW